MNAKLKRLLKLILGWFLLVLGVIGLFLPVLQGMLMILGGLAVLSSEYPWARRWLEWCKAKVHKIKRKAKVGKNSV